MIMVRGYLHASLSQRPARGVVQIEIASRVRTDICLDSLAAATVHRRPLIWTYTRSNSRTKTFGRTTKRNKNTDCTLFDENVDGVNKVAIAYRTGEGT